MSIALPLETMSIAEKLETMETLWDDLCRHADKIAVPEWHREVLTVREADLREGKESFTDWETAKDQLRDALK